MSDLSQPHVVAKRDALALRAQALGWEVSNDHNFFKVSNPNSPGIKPITVKDVGELELVISSMERVLGKTQ